MTRRLMAMIAATLTVVAGLASIPAGVGADPIIGVTPNAHVIDGQDVTVLARGFEPGSSVAVGMCRTEVLTTLDVFGDCDTSHYQLRTANSQGRIRVEFTAYRFLALGAGPVDCAEAGACIIGASHFSSLADITTGATIPITFDPDVANDAPPAITTTVRRVGARTATLDLTCDRPIGVRVNASLIQPRGVNGYTWPRLGGRAIVECDGATSVVVALEPHQRSGRGGLIWPYRRVLPGPAELEVITSADAGRFSHYERLTHDHVVTEPALTRRIRIDHDGIATELRGLRISRAGRAVARVEVTCDGNEPSIYVLTQVVAPAPGATYRTASGGAEVSNCGPAAQTVSVPLNDFDAAFHHRTDIVPAGPVEAYVTAGVDDGDGAVDMRPLTTRRDMRPANIRIRPNPASRLTIGRANGERVRASFDCPRSAPFTVVALLAQPVGDVVFQTGGQTVMSCVAGRTVVFDVPWFDGARADVRSAIQLFAMQGGQGSWPGPFQHRQAGWRTVR